MFIIIIIIIIKNGRKFKAGRELLTSYQSGDPSLTIPSHRKKEEKNMRKREKKGDKK